MILEITWNQAPSIGVPVVGLLILMIFSLREHFFAKEKTEVHQASLELKKNIQNHTLPLRLQAYERLTLLIERITPSNLFLRINPQGLTARDMQAICLNEIRNEFDHNVSQQLYVTESAWQSIKKTKDETVLTINSITSSLPVDATGLDLSRAVLEHVSKGQSDPYSNTISVLRAEVAKF
ncbi:DUF7935 family protein [Solitalea koreensis]|uniref:Uncharacterized protein n=1 Tax=Solitalea koreensis TaxID=543615 RepID=A0A521CS78_9SPHI|nr:hypothetical protein [Solitalea koreensis]SMO62339.1 hypothetical protein SAMN06265350_104320 [Solitalea koreensis]